MGGTRYVRMERTGCGDTHAVSTDAGEGLTERARMPLAVAGKEPQAFDALTDDY